MKTQKDSLKLKDSIEYRPSGNTSNISNFLNIPKNAQVQKGANKANSFFSASHSERSNLSLNLQTELLQHQPNKGAFRPGLPLDKLREIKPTPPNFNPSRNETNRLTQTTAEGNSSFPRGPLTLRNRSEKSNIRLLSEEHHPSKESQEQNFQIKIPISSSVQHRSSSVRNRVNENLPSHQRDTVNLKDSLSTRLRIKRRLIDGTDRGGYYSNTTVAFPTESSKTENYENQVEVQALDIWDSEHRQHTRSRSHRNFASQYQNKKEVTDAHDQEILMPKLNQRVINFIINEEDQKKSFAQTMTSFQGKIQPRSTRDRIQHETNRKIISSILTSKISKSSNKKSGDDKTSEKSNRLGQDTVNNFKSLRENLGGRSPSKIIDYDSIYKALVEKKEQPQLTFEFTDFLRQKEKEEKMKSLADKEAELLLKYHNNLDDTQEKKNSLAKLLIEKYNLTNEIKDYQQEIEEADRDLMRTETIAKERRENMMLKHLKISRRRGTGGGQKLDEYRMMEMKRTEVAKIISNAKENIEIVKKKIVANQEKAQFLQNQINELKLRKSELRFELKNLYIKMLKNEPFLLEREDSIIYIIKKLWKIGEEVKEEHFPSYLSQESLKYLFEYAKREYQLEELENFKKNNKEIASQSQLDEKTKSTRSHPNLRNTSLKEALATIQRKFSKIKHGLIKKKRPVFADDDEELGQEEMHGQGMDIIRWEDIEEKQGDEASKEQNDSTLNFQKKFEMTKENIKAEMAWLREQEIQRILRTYVTKNITHKNLEELSKLLLCIFGKSLGDKIYFDFVKQKQQRELNVKQRQTFKFESVRSATSFNPSNMQSSFSLMVSYASTFKKKEKSTLDGEEQKVDLGDKIRTQQNFLRKVQQDRDSTEPAKSNDQNEIDNELLKTKIAKDGFSRTAMSFLNAHRNLKTSSATER